MTGGIENTSIKLETSQGTFLFRIWNKARPERVLDELELMERIHKELGKTQNPNFEIGKVHKTKDGKNRIIVNEKPAAVIGFVEGTTHKRMSNRTLRKLGEFLAITHNALRAFNPRTEATQRDLVVETEKMKEKFKMLLKIDEISLQQREYAYNLCIQELSILKGKSKQIRSKKFSEGILHSDLGKGNIVKGKKLGIIDFSDWGKGFLLQDLGNMVYNLAKDKQEKFSKSKMKAIVEGYSRRIKMRKSEIKELPFFVRQAELRKVLTALKRLGKEPQNRKQNLERIINAIKNIKNRQKALRFKKQKITGKRKPAKKRKLKKRKLR